MTVEVLEPVRTDEPVPAGRAQLDALFRSQAPRLIRFLTRRASHQDAHDLAQEAFLRLTRIVDRQALLNPEAYLQRIARNLLRDRAKSAAGRYERGHAPFDPEAHPAHDGDPHQALVARQTLARYEAAVMGLKPKTREIFLLHRLDGKSYVEIAQIVGLSESGVTKQMMKAIAHIDRALSRL
ncbi:RNA polymerase sigma factor [Caulobacter soli]|uniref:RNA polymerase sigma factor n=1 Tax=Caulobacter soli TaxID=2708539 RepID=UPI0013E9DC68|nr:RNA polymerase sigma factor [Caulobacter soli]